MKNCLFCGARHALGIRSDKKGRPYLRCDACGTLAFPRGRPGLRLIDLWSELLESIPLPRLCEIQAEADAGLGFAKFMSNIMPRPETVTQSAPALSKEA